MSEERLQKVIAQAGVASRRAAEALITEGRVRVNGRVVTTLGAKADPGKDRIDVDGKRVVAEKPAYYVLHKPRGVVTTLDDPEGRNTIAQLVKAIPERVFPVGRLDYHTSGVLLVTNDGAMSQALLHPRRTVPKTYVAKVRGVMDVAQLDMLRNGVQLGGGEVSRKAEVFVLREERNNTWIQLTITEGKNRQIHRMVEAVGGRVGRLARVAFAGLTVEGLRPGEHRELGATELHKLKRDYLNPQRRAVAAEVRKEALEAAMVALGYEPDDAGDFDPADDGDGPIVERRASRPPRPARSVSGPPAVDELRTDRSSSGGPGQQRGGNGASRRPPRERGPREHAQGDLGYRGRGSAEPGNHGTGQERIEAQKQFGKGFDSSRSRRHDGKPSAGQRGGRRGPQVERLSDKAQGRTVERIADRSVDQAAGRGSSRGAGGSSQNSGPRNGNGTGAGGSYRSPSTRPPAAGPTVEVMTVRRRNGPASGGFGGGQTGTTNGAGGAPVNDRSERADSRQEPWERGDAGHFATQQSGAEGHQEPHRRRVVRKVVTPRNPPTEHQTRKPLRRRKSD